MKTDSTIILFCMCSIILLGACSDSQPIPELNRARPPRQAATEHLNENESFPQPVSVENFPEAALVAKKESIERSIETGLQRIDQELASPPLQ